MISFDPIQTLKVKKLKVTYARLTVLSCFESDNKHAYSFNEIYAVASLKIDRVSIYRILDVFTEKCILFRLVDESGRRLFILNSFHITNIELSALLKCSACHEVDLLPNPPLQYLKVLNTHKIHFTQFLYSGLCSNCVGIE